MANPQRYYHRVTDIASAHEAIKQVTDHNYDLRERLDHLEGIMRRMHSGPPGMPAQPGFVGNVQGINVKAVTDPLSLKQGWSLKYNAATGELEFGP